MRERQDSDGNCLSLIRTIICDDHRVFAEGLAALLNAEPDIEVVGTAAGVNELLDLVRTHRPQCVLLDYRLPDGDGVAATVALKEFDPEVAVLMLTSFTDDQVMIAAMQAGCSGYVTKHETADVIANGVRAAVAGEAVISAALLSRLLSQVGANDPAPVTNLSPRELEILGLLVEGVSNQEVAERLFVSLNTVRNHVQHILQKLGAHSRLEATAIAVREGIVKRP